jgi:hypothetical protein
MTILLAEMTLAEPQRMRTLSVPPELSLVERLEPPRFEMGKTMLLVVL